jgi:L,D-transpeptidase YbiS
MTRLIKVWVSRQELEFFENGQLVWSAFVSTSANGLGEEPGSFKTPRGKHHIVEKIGEGEPLGMVFKGRKPTGRIWTTGEITQEDLITTRILTLAGDEEENQTTQQRHVYFHGTNHEDLIGQPKSRGCIRLENDDMLKLFDLAEIDTPVEILE